VKSNKTKEKRRDFSVHSIRPIILIPKLDKNVTRSYRSLFLIYSNTNIFKKHLANQAQKNRTILMYGQVGFNPKEG
jgi:hypothetical protein